MLPAYVETFGKAYDLTLPKRFKKPKSKAEYAAVSHLVARDSLSQWLTQLRRKIRGCEVKKSSKGPLRQSGIDESENDEDSNSSD
jgi:hypothetical protein